MTTIWAPGPIRTKVEAAFRKPFWRLPRRRDSGSPRAQRVPPASPRTRAASPVAPRSPGGGAGRPARLASRPPGESSGGRVLFSPPCWPACVESDQRDLSGSRQAAAPRCLFFFFFGGCGCCLRRVYDVKLASELAIRRKWHRLFLFKRSDRNSMSHSTEQNEMETWVFYY